MNRLFPSLLYKLLPGRCVICKGHSHRQIDLCQDCENELPTSPSPCMQCGMANLTISTQNRVCGACIAHKPSFDRTFCAFTYISPVNLLIKEFKNGHNLVFGKVMSQVLAKKYKATLVNRPAPHLLLPVPLHKNRLKLRGFNQAAEIAQVVGDACDIKTNTRACSRSKDTADQKSLPAHLRKDNVAQVFRLNRNFNGYRIAIVDDVITTGSTVTALAELLRQKGASSIEVIALARTPRR